MRLVAGVLSLALFAPFARAEDTATPPAPAPGSPATPVPASPPPASPASNPGAWARVPFRVVRVMPETRQALLFDRARNTHVLAEVGGKLDGYTIEDIDDETVSLRRDNQQVVLAAPPHGASRGRELPPVRLRSALAVPVSDAAVPGAGGPPALEGPPAPGVLPAPGGPPAPIDPYGDLARPADGPSAQPPAPAPGDALPPEPGIRVAHAPGGAAPLASAPVIVPGEGGVRVAVAPDVGPAPGLSAAPRAPGPAWSLAPSEAAPPAGPGAIRVVSAAPAAAPPPSPPPGAPSAAPVAPAAPGAAPAVLSAAPAAPGAAPAAPTGAPVASSPAPAVPGASATASGAGGPGEPDRRSREIAEPIPTVPGGPAAARTAAIEPADPRPAEIREVRAADAARAPDKQTADARALADILTADRPTRGPRAPAELLAPTHAAEVRPAAVAPPAPGDAVAISRGDLDGALADFARLTAGIRGSFSATGVVIDGVGDGTIFQRAGLRAGDVVTSVDGVRLRTLDDAANLYARAATARAITAQVVRAGKPVTLHVVIQ